MAVPQHTLQPSWSPGSWRTRPNPYGMIEYQDGTKANEVLSQIGILPPLVTFTEVAYLKSLLASAVKGEAFVIQAGDCAEMFEYCTESAIGGRLALLIQLSTLFRGIANMPTVVIARLAGQYGKPRNSLTEVVNGRNVPKFHGDIINSHDVNNRQPDPERMATAFARSSITTNYVRSVLAFPSLPMLTNSFVPSKDPKVEHGEGEAPRIIQNIGKTRQLRRHEADRPQAIFTSHEGLFLHYEQAVTKSWPSPSGDHHFNGSAHFVWIGDKTRQVDGAHVEYFRGLSNPIGVKLGPSTDPAELPELLRILDPLKEMGKVTLITRLGAGRVVELLSGIIRTVQASGHSVVWQCDPLHGNTRCTKGGIRTRSYEDVMTELVKTIEIHVTLDSRLAGIHLEMTSDDVVECTGGPEGWRDDELGTAYKTTCDPRLNAIQAQALVYSAATCLKGTGSCSTPVPRRHKL